MNLGLEIVASALREGTLLPFLAAGINDAWLNSREDFSSKAIFDDPDRGAYQTLLNHWDRHGKVPSLDIFQRSHPAVSYRLPDSDHTPDELIDIVRESRKLWLAQIAFSDVADCLGNERVDDALQIMDNLQATLGSLKSTADRPYRKVTLAELDELPQPELLIEGIVDAGTVTMLSGPFSTGKSFIALDWALSIASGTDWMGHEVTQCRVLYVSAEGAHGQSKRVKAWKAEHPKARPDANFEMIINPVQLGEPDHLEALLGDARNADVVVIDTVARCSTGLEENSARDMGTFIEALYKLRDAHSEYGTTIIPVHHTGHDKSRARGSSALPAGVDAVFLTESTDPHTLITMKSVKRKDGPPPAPMHMKLIESEGSVVLESVDAVFAEANSHGDRSKQIIDYLREHPSANGREIAHALGESTATISRTLRPLVDAGKVLEKAEGRSKHYWLP